MRRLCLNEEYTFEHHQEEKWIEVVSVKNRPKQVVRINNHADSSVSLLLSATTTGMDGAQYPDGDIIVIEPRTEADMNVEQPGVCFFIQLLSTLRPGEEIRLYLYDAQPSLLPPQPPNPPQQLPIPLSAYEEIGSILSEKKEKNIDIIPCPPVIVLPMESKSSETKKEEEKKEQHDEANKETSTGGVRLQVNGRWHIFLDRNQVYVYEHPYDDNGHQIGNSNECHPLPLLRMQFNNVWHRFNYDTLTFEAQKSELKPVLPKWISHLPTAYNQRPKPKPADQESELLIKQETPTPTEEKYDDAEGDDDDDDAEEGEGDDGDDDVIAPGDSEEDDGEECEEPALKKRNIASSSSFVFLPQPVSPTEWFDCQATSTRFEPRRRKPGKKEEAKRPCDKFRVAVLGLAGVCAVTLTVLTAGFLISF